MARSDHARVTVRGVLGSIVLVGAVMMAVGGLAVIIAGMFAPGLAIIVSSVGAGVVGLFCFTPDDQPRVEIPEYKPRSKLKVVGRD